MTESDPLDLLKCISCFASLSPEAVDYVQGMVKELSFAKGEVIILEGEPCPGLFVVRSGSVKLYRTSPEGDEQIVRVIRRGGCFECVPLFDGGKNPVSAEALEASQLYFLSAADFDSLLRYYPQATPTFTSILARRLRSLVNRVGDFSTRKIHSRLARLLYELSERDGDRIVVSPSPSLNQEHLACMLGCSRQAVNISLRKLVQAGIVKMEGHRIIILNAEALRRIP